MKLYFTIILENHHQIGNESTIGPRTLEDGDGWVKLTVLRNHQCLQNNSWVFMLLTDIYKNGKLEVMNTIVKYLNGSFANFYYLKI